MKVLQKDCPECGGTGKITIEVGPASTKWREELCMACEGEKPSKDELKSSGPVTWK